VNALAETLGISRTPTREAVSWLERDGLVVQEGTSGRVIARLDHNTVNELYAIRAVLEVRGAALAAQNASEAEVDVLREMLAIEKDLLQDPIRRARHNRRFHDAIYLCAHNRFLISSLNALQTPMLLLGGEAVREASHLKKAHQEHIDLVRAIAERDAQRAATIVTEHLASGQRAHIRALLDALQ
jgi:DNA-binding GntR family transcriptional regulator